MRQDHEMVGLNRRQFLAAAGAGVAGLAFEGCHAAEMSTVAKVKSSSAGGKRPNVVLIVADDLGYGELGCYGGKEIPTPNIDAIAAGGVRFTNGYVSCPVCSPTRAGLLTGRYQQRFGHEFNPGQSAAVNAIFGLPKTETTLADRMKKAGYATGIVGKWHLGANPGYRPTERGFDEFYGFLGGAHAYFEPGKNRTIFRGTEPVDEGRYLTEAIAEEAVGFVDRNQNTPFFLYVSFNAVHAPLQVPDKYLQRFDTITDAKRRTFAGMLSALDDGVGKVIGCLDQLGLQNDTMIFFISDNGGPTPSTTSGNGPLQGFKGQVLEGGIQFALFL